MMKHRFSLLIIVVGAIILSLGGMAWYCWHQTCFHGGHQLYLPDGQTANVGLLTDKKHQQRGFSYQNQPCLDCGLLFVWPVLLQPTMVMREMSFALDFVWLRDKQIVQIIENAAPEGQRPLINYQPAQPVDAVLEVPAGFVQRHNLQIGQFLSWR